MFRQTISIPHYVIKQFYKRLLVYIIPALFSMVLNGCILIAPPPARTFDLSAPKNVTNLQGRAGQLLIVEPSALQALDSKSIVVKPSAAEITYFGQAQWTDRLPKLLQAKIQETFEATGRARAVGKPGDGLVIDYQILTTIRAFELNAAEQFAEVTLAIKIVNDRTGRVVGARDFSAQVNTNSDDLDIAIAALDEAMDQVLIALVRWVFARI